MGAGLASHPRETDRVGSEGALRGGIKYKIKKEKKRKNNKSEVTRSGRRVANVRLEEKGRGGKRTVKESGAGEGSSGAVRAGPGRREAGAAAGGRRAGGAGRSGR